MIEEMQTGEIINYLRDNRGYHVQVNFTRDMYFTEFKAKFSELSWREFLMYCDHLDNELMFDRAEKYLKQWQTANIIRTSFDKE